MNGWKKLNDRGERIASNLLGWTYIRRKRRMERSWTGYLPLSHTRSVSMYVTNSPEAWLPNGWIVGLSLFLSCRKFGSKGKSGQERRYLRQPSYSGQLITTKSHRVRKQQCLYCVGGQDSFQNPVGDDIYRTPRPILSCFLRQFGQTHEVFEMLRLTWEATVNSTYNSRRFRNSFKCFVEWAVVYCHWCVGWVRWQRANLWFSELHNQSKA